MERAASFVIGPLSLHKLQLRLLCRALASVKKGGGRVVYSTCSLDVVEDECLSIVRGRPGG